MYTALGKLGYKSYHMVEAGKNRHANYWLEALTAKVYGTGKGYGKAEFDKLLKEYSVRVPLRCVCLGIGADSLLNWLLGYHRCSMCLLPRRARCCLSQCQSRPYDAGTGYVGSIYGEDILYNPSLEGMAFG